MAASRIEAACALVTAAQHSPLHASISKRQKLALLKVLKDASLSVDELPNLVQLEIFLEIKKKKTKTNLKSENSIKKLETLFFDKKQKHKN